ncbi:MAG TPA: hypothetical protein DDX57_03005 [Bacteroidales bacterium]|nr:MAG: hypothetical protein A2W94_00020 [Bacteroidetes bacterium GWE2_42_42]HBG69738.1 hypothetical protein [Bacteroidales bacterium]HCB61114.1 hypothetical protein [Bacteroidales bacterium]
MYNDMKYFIFCHFLFVFCFNNMMFGCRKNINFSKTTYKSHQMLKDKFSNAHDSNRDRSLSRKT